MSRWYCRDDSIDIEELEEAETAQEAAEQYVAHGSYIYTETVYVHVHVRPAGEEDGEWHMVRVDPEPPPCVQGHTHAWKRGEVYGHGGGVVYHEMCRHCEAHRVVDTWATDPGSGKIVEVISYG